VFPVSPNITRLTITRVMGEDASAFEHWREPYLPAGHYVYPGFLGYFPNLLDLSLGGDLRDWSTPPHLMYDQGDMIAFTTPLIPELVKALALHVGPDGKWCCPRLEHLQLSNFDIIRPDFDHLQVILLTRIGRTRGGKHVGPAKDCRLTLRHCAWVNDENSDDDHFVDDDYEYEPLPESIGIDILQLKRLFPWESAQLQRRDRPEPRREKWGFNS